jgi:hypothetical protein
MTNFLTRMTARSFFAESAIRPRVASLFESAGSESARNEPVGNSESALRDVPVEEAGTDLSAEVESVSVVAPKTADDGPVSAVAGQPTMDSLRRDTFARSDETKREGDIAAAAKLRPRGIPSSSLAENATRSHPSSSARSDLRSAASSGTSALHTKTGNGDMREKKIPVVPATGALAPVVTGEDRPLKPELSQLPNRDISRLAAFSRPEFDDGPHKRATPPTVSPFGVESFAGNDRGLVPSPKVMRELTAQMQTAASAMNAAFRGPTRNKPAAPGPASDAEPSIHVSIGRIEVRASSEREGRSVGRPRAVSPVMSLEEYLHRRTQRGDQ